MAKRPKPPTPEGLTLDRILRHFSTDEAAREYLESVRWPNGPVCAHCGGTEKVYAIAANPEAKVRPGLYQCGDCKGQFTVTVGTIFEDSKVPLRKWLVAWYLLCSSKKGFAAAQLQRALELGSYRTAWFMFHRIRYALRDAAFDDKLGGTVEADETWIGGRRRNVGQGYVKNKTPVVSLVERDGRVRSAALEQVTGRNLQAILEEHVDSAATLMTDENAGYYAAGRRFAAHHTVNHSEKEYVRGEAHINTAEGYFANLKRGIDGVYHHVGKQYLDQYLGEFDFRYNGRKVSDGERTIAGLRKAAGKRLVLRRPVSKKRAQ
jgi:transposase-like protein